MASGLGYLGCLLALAAVASKLLHNRGRRASPNFRFHISALIFTGASTALSDPDTLHAAGTISALPPYVFLVANGCAMIGAFSLVAMLAYSLGNVPTATRRMTTHAMILLASFFSMAILLIAEHPRHIPSLNQDYVTPPTLVIYQAIFLVYVQGALSRFLILMLKFRRKNTLRPLLRVGLTLEMCGAGISLLWVTWNIVTMIVVVLGGQPVSSPAIAGALVAASTVLFVATGATWTGWASTVLATATRIWSHRTFGALGPLWSELYEVGEMMILRIDADTPIGLLLYRRILEIRDAQLALRPYVHPSVRAWTTEAADKHKLGPARTAILIEAAELATALDGHRAAHRNGLDTSKLAVPPTIAPSVPAEARTLVAVDKAMRNDPLVRGLRTRATAAPLPGVQRHAN